MHVTKEMVNEELRKSFLPSKWIAFFLSKRWVVRLINKLGARISGGCIDDLVCEERWIPSQDESHQIRIRIFRPKNVIGELPGFLYLHGGGYMIGKPEMYLDTIKKFIDAQPCVVIAPDYRKALDALMRDVRRRRVHYSVICSKLDRLGRSLAHLAETIRAQCRTTFPANVTLFSPFGR